MMTKDQFRPNWSSPPGATISSLLKKKSITLESFGRKIGLSDTKIKSLLCGDTQIDKSLALKLEESLGASSDFWLRREQQYREDLKWENSEESKNLEDIFWLNDIPYKEMISHGWIEKVQEKKDIARQCLDFFEVKHSKDWYNIYSQYLAKVMFKTSLTFESQATATLAWLKKGEKEANNRNLQEWNPEKFKITLTDIRKLTRVKSPSDFIPELQKLCDSCGVAFVIIKAPKGCSASGATKFIDDNRALILQSIRYRSDDHFWFTFFHEAGHLLLHKKTDIFLETQNLQKEKEEEEANLFAEEIIIPPQMKKDLYQLQANNHRKIMRFAKKIGVSPGLVVGQMQHLKIIENDRMNFLKTRYSWL